MSEISYSLSDRPFDPAELSASENFAIVAEGRLLLRTRSNGQTFALTYRTESHARRGLTAARLHVTHDVSIWRRLDAK